MTLFTVDVSHHDWDRNGGPLDWAAIRRSGITVMCARASYGDPSTFNPPSPHFADFHTGARNAGFALRGGYHNLIAGDQASINRQVDLFRRQLAAVSADWAMLDIERYPELLANNLWPRLDDVQQFVSRWRQVDSRPLALYLPRWVWTDSMASASLTGLGEPLVSSNYGPNAAGSPSTLYGQRLGDAGPGWTPYGGVTPALWQFGSQARIPGASPATDVNAYRGTLAELTALLTGKEEDVALTGAQDTALSIAWEVADALRDGQEVTESRKDPVWLVKQIKALAADLAAVKAALAAPVDEAKLAADIAAALIASGTNGLTDADHAAVRADVAAVLAGSHIVPS